ncbi:MAG TPA: FAD:protein FMN transferase, partial [Methylomirabilota bacterium]|nr:FAD:protein FMN transferase [Methylomirabilota bacterium]
PTSAAPAPPAPLPELLEIRGREARLAKGAAIDLGGIAKGWLADRLAERLGPNTLVNLCGDLFARGPGESGEGWPVGFGDKTVLLHDLGAATSGTTKRMWGPGLHHLIDPRTARPAVSDLREVSVIAQSATDAEIYAKVALILGSIEGPKWLQGRALGWSLT